MAATDLDQRQAFSQSGQGVPITLGQLYDARSEKVLMRSILKTTELPPGSVICRDTPGLTYKHTTTDSFEEKLSNLDLSAELGISVLCGLLGGGGYGQYLSREENKTCIRQASTICITTTKSETLRLENVDLQRCLDLSAIHTPDATHVICGIAWGARALVSVEELKKNAKTGRHIKAKLGERPTESYENPERQGKMGDHSTRQNEDMLGQLARYIGTMHVTGKAESDSTLDSVATMLEFKIIADVAHVSDHGITSDFEGVKNFIRSLPASLNDTNGGKGVPLTFYLSPIKEVASIFKIDIQHDNIVMKLEQDSLDDIMDLLRKFDVVIRSLETYVNRATQNSYCVPLEQIKKVQKELGRVKRQEKRFKDTLATTIKRIRSGVENADDLSDFLSDSVSDLREENSSSMIRKYINKMSFAEIVRDANAEYLSHDSLNETISRHRNSDVYIMYCNEAAQRQPGWDEERQALFDLLRDGAGQYCVVVVDYDVPEPKSFEQAYIELRRDGKIVIPNITQHWKDLSELCQLKCCIDSKADRTRSVVPPLGRRVVRIPCPGENCFQTGNLKWNCPVCRDPVCYGFTDDFLYCLCSRYSYMDAVFKCNHAMHGRGFVKYGEEDLDRRLKALDPTEEYNILILGKSGVGKSMFINALINYLEFDSLDDAMADPDPLLYKIPFSFDYQDEQYGDHRVVVGSESIWEKFSLTGKSATRSSVTYCFDMDGRTIRFIDTPGIGDTEGIGKDQDNAENILRMLESIHKLSAILILLPPNEARLDTAFRFCITELLSRLHVDTTKNILFGFTNSSLTDFTLGATKVPLDSMLANLQTGIARGQSNQYFFDSKGFMFLAAWKKNHLYMPGSKNKYAEFWEKSADATHRLITTVMALPTHDVNMTLKLNRTRLFLEGMVKPLTRFTTSTDSIQKELVAAELELAEAVAKGENLAEKAKEKIPVKVPIRKKLEHQRTVCTHNDCTTQEADDKGTLHTVFNTVCHEKCNTKVPDEIKGSPGLEKCKPFRRGKIFISFGNPCENKNCQHDWKEHMRISYEFKIEEQRIDNKPVQEEIRTNEDGMRVLEHKIKTAQEHQKIMREERIQIQTARALFFVYLNRNAVGKSMAYNDATIQYLDLHIKVAEQDGRTDEAAELILQRSTHIDQVQDLEEAIGHGTVTAPNEQVVEEAIQGLKRMRFFGQGLAHAVESNTIELDSRFVFVEPSKKSKLRRWFHWR